MPKMKTTKQNRPAQHLSPQQRQAAIRRGMEAIWRGEQSALTKKLLTAAQNMFTKSNADRQLRCSDALARAIRRYGRLHAKGFDQWFAEHTVKLKQLSTAADVNRCKSERY